MDSEIQGDFCHNLKEQPTQARCESQALPGLEREREKIAKRLLFKGMEVRHSRKVPTWQGVRL